MSGPAAAQTSPPLTGGRHLAWFHCFAGIAGDMAVGSLLDAGADLGEVLSLLERLPLGGWALEVEPVLRGGIAASRRATASDIRRNRPPASASLSTNTGAEYRNGIVRWATTCRTVQPSHSDGASHCSALSPASMAASSRRSAVIESLIMIPPFDNH